MAPLNGREKCEKFSIPPLSSPPPLFYSFIHQRASSLLHHNILNPTLKIADAETIIRPRIECCREKVSVKRRRVTAEEVDDVNTKDLQNLVGDELQAISSRRGFLDASDRLLLTYFGDKMLKYKTPEIRGGSPKVNKDLQEILDQEYGACFELLLGVLRRCRERAAAEAAAAVAAE